MKETEAINKLIQRKGKFQNKLAFALIAMAIPNGAQLLIGVFITYLPDHMCKISEEFAVKQTYETRSNLTLTMNNKTIKNVEIGKCSITYSNNSLQVSGVADEKSHVLPSCVHGWQYITDTEDVFSAAMEFNWVCSREWMGPFLFSCQMFGIMIGSLVSSAIPDRFGRKWPYIVANVIKNFTFTLAAFSPNSIYLFLLMVLYGVMVIATAMIGVIIGTECLQEELRHLVSMAQLGMYAAGYMYLPGLAYIIPNWRHLIFVTGCIGIFSLFLVYYLVESPRWLFLKGKKEEAIKVLMYIAKENQLNRDEYEDIFKNFEIIETINNEKCESKSIESKFLSDTNNNIIDIKESKLEKEKSKGFPSNEKFLVVEQSEKKVRENLGYLDLFKKTCLRYRFLVCCFSWFAVNLGYYGSTFSTNELGKNRYINCFLMGLAEVPGIALCVFLLNKVGGRKALIFFSGTSSIFLLGVALFQSFSHLGTLVCAMIAKMLLSGSFNVNYAYTGEVFPTLIRNQAYGSCSFVSRIAAILTPFLIYIGKLYSMSIPYTVMSVVGMFCVLAFYKMPDTKGKPIPDTMADILQQEREIRYRKSIGFTCRKKRKESSEPVTYEI